MAMVACNSAAGNGKEVPEVVEANCYLESATFVTSETLHVDGGARRSLRQRCVGPQRAGDFGLGALVEVTDARNECYWQGARSRGGVLLYRISPFFGSTG